MKKYIIIGISVLVILLVAGYYMFTSGTPHYVTAVVERGSIMQEASANGNVEAPTIIDLQFRVLFFVVYIISDFYE